VIILALVKIGIDSIVTVIRTAPCNGFLPIRTIFDFFVLATTKRIQSTGGYYV
jgi:hypothetical protein